jgi:hypothetical protein
MEHTACGGKEGAPCFKDRDIGHPAVEVVVLDVVGGLLGVGGMGGELGLDPAIGAGVEQVQWEDAAAEHLIVEGADVELGPELPLGAHGTSAGRACS